MSEGKVPIAGEDGEEGRNANHCLPLLVANEAGWVLLNERRFTAEWSGGKRPDAVTIRYEGRRPSGPALSNLGYGIVIFEEGDPVCMLVPQRRHDLARFRAHVRPVDEETEARWRAAQRSRHQLAVKKFLAEYSADHPEARDEWESDYFRGLAPDGSPAPEHVTKRRLQPFGDPD